jgi:predicted Fe-Mo cluster-binding NifX family protein
MGKVGMTLLRPDWQSPLSPHFGMAGWLLIYDAKADQKNFQRNRLLMGKGVVDIFVQHRCTDAIFSNIGPGALEILRAAGIRAWYGPADVPASRLIDRLRQGELEPANEARSQDHDCTSGHSGRGKPSGCCRQGRDRGKARPREISLRRSGLGSGAAFVKNERE